jgi:transcriptional regulator of the spore photoproduct lyase operon
MDLMEPEFTQYQAGDVVYVIYRNPHTYNVVNIQEAAVVHNPDHPGELALFLYETYYPFDADIAIYQSKMAANQALSSYLISME